MTRIPVPCPCCQGDGHRHDGWTGSVDTSAHCPACGGSGKAPTGRGHSPEAIARMLETRRERQGASGQRVAWTPAEESFVMAADRAWRKRGKPRRSSTWFTNLSARLHARYPEQPARTISALKQRINSLNLEARSEDSE